MPQAGPLTAAPLFYGDTHNLPFTACQNVALIDQKIKEPATPVELEDLTAILDQINDVISQINDKIRKYNALILDTKKKDRCITAVWEQLAFVCHSIIIAYQEAVKLNNFRLNNNITKINALNSEDTRLQNEIKDLNKDTVNTTAAKDAINALLHSAGFQGFELEEKPNTQYVYQLVRNGHKNNKETAENLSEGERNFIAFLYYYQTIIGSQSDDGIKHDKIVVIDDPVSSMDSSTLFVVASLVRNLIAICYNNYDLSETTGRDDYVRQFFCLTHNPYFFREISYNRVADYNCVSFFQITKSSDNQSDIQPCESVMDDAGHTPVNVSPVKNAYDALWHEYKVSSDPIVLMNVIRRILECYFMQNCGKTNLRIELLDLHRADFVDRNVVGSEDTHRYDLASAMISYLDTGDSTFNDGLFFDPSAINPETFREVFEDIFKSLGQEEHYKMMYSRG